MAPFLWSSRRVPPLIPWCSVGSMPSWLISKPLGDSFRGELRVKFDHEVTAEDEANYHLIVWGDAAANQYLERLLPELPLNWTEEELELCGHTVSSDHHLPILIQPNPRSPGHYVVLNSGPTFREAHDRTNSLQNPKLPDWALLDLSEPPTDESAGRVLDAGFFDEQWR
ncbi:MAG: hypothetical protein R3B96_01960 [Pirellulaceae bacterium]